MTFLDKPTNISFIHKSDVLWNINIILIYVHYLENIKYKKTQKLKTIQLDKL